MRSSAVVIADNEAPEELVTLRNFCTSIGFNAELYMRDDLDASSFVRVYSGCSSFVRVYSGLFPDDNCIALTLRGSCVVAFFGRCNLQFADLADPTSQLKLKKNILECCKHRTINSACDCSYYRK